ncbi:MAG: hypothetical protein IPO21_01515 [Bacteroidales bacterium]|nr:hypothetical protein [Bacteroidales bacterium]
MKNVQLVLLSLVLSFLLFSCSKHEKLAAEGMEAELNGTEWVATSITAKISDTECEIIGEADGKTVRLLLVGEPKYGTNKLTGGSKIIYETSSDIKTFIGEGEVFFDKIDYEEDIIEGTFYANLEEEFMIKKGRFKNLKFEDLSSKDSLRDTAKVDTVIKNFSKVEADYVLGTGTVLDYTADSAAVFNLTDGKIKGNAISKSNILFYFEMPSTIKSGTYTLEGSNEYIITATANSVAYNKISSGKLIINEHDTSTKKIVGTYQFEATDANSTGKNMSVYNGKFTIYYQ